MAIAYNLHCDWREEDPRRVIEKVRQNHGHIVPYAHAHGRYRQFIVSWTELDGECSGGLYIIHLVPIKREKISRDVIRSLRASGLSLATPPL